MMKENTDYEGNIPEWVKDASFRILVNISNKNFNFLKQKNISSALSENLLKIDFDIYPKKISTPPNNAKEKFYILELSDGSGWWLACPFFDEFGNQTDLELQMNIYGKKDNYNIIINDILVP